ncbi:hypothetical protein LTR66_007827 [Elasticomyces elasticus]|nr:hypothetical protein LTR66_007827 [Elasticomyces elasticus]
MALQNSIQAFFPPRSSPNPSSPTKSISSSAPGDGFTRAEVDTVLHPTLSEIWTPSADYQDCDIAALVPGPKSVTFMGRIANFFDMAMPSKKPHAASGCVRVVVKDDTGAVTVRRSASFRFLMSAFENKQLAQHLSTIYVKLTPCRSGFVWTTHISNGDGSTLSASSAPLFVSVFPERDRSSYFMVHENSDDGILCKSPLGYRESQSLGGLMTLKNFVNGGFDVSEARILVIVKSIGARKRITNRKGTTSEVIRVGIFDDTEEATLTLWGAVTESAAPWKPSSTVLLITNPGWKIGRKTHVSLTANTLVFDVETAFSSPLQILYDLADISEFARAAPQGGSLYTWMAECELTALETFIGYLSMIIMELNIMVLYRRNMLMCAEW